MRRPLILGLLAILAYIGSVPVGTIGLGWLELPLTLRIAAYTVALLMAFFVASTLLGRALVLVWRRLRSH